MGRGKKLRSMGEADLQFRQRREHIGHYMIVSKKHPTKESRAREEIVQTWNKFRISSKTPLSPLALTFVFFVLRVLVVFYMYT
jgi:hypothetical protein